MLHRCDGASSHYELSEAPFSSPRRLEGREGETDANGRQSEKAYIGYA